MTRWGAFAGFSGVVVLLLLILARISASIVTDRESSAASDGSAEPPQRYSPYDRDGTSGDAPEDATAEPDTPQTAVTERAPDTPTADDGGAEAVGTSSRDDAPSESGVRRDGPTPSPDAPVDGEADTGEEAARGGEAASDGEAATGGEAATVSDAQSRTEWSVDRPRSFGTGELLVNVLVTHGLFATLVAGAAVYWGVPARALGLGAPILPAVGWGLVAGLGLYVANELGAAGAERVGIDHQEMLRELLAPDSTVGWVLLLGGVLPVVAVAEELIFRGVLVGALAVGFGLPVWALAVASSVVFGLAHGAQGRGGVVVTGLLGFALAAGFVLGGSLVLVMVAHYVVNALEFIVHEGLEVEWVE